MIYLDNSATTKPCKEAVEAMTDALTVNWGNPSALYGFGIDTAAMLRTTRHKVAQLRIDSGRLQKGCAVEQCRCRSPLAPLKGKRVSYL